MGAIRAPFLEEPSEDSPDCACPKLAGFGVEAGADGAAVRMEGTAQTAMTMRTIFIWLTHGYLMGGEKSLLRYESLSEGHADRRTISCYGS